MNQIDQLDLIEKISLKYKVKRFIINFVQNFPLKTKTTKPKNLTVVAPVKLSLIGTHTLSWTSGTEPFSAYYVYWRGQGSTQFKNTNRVVSGKVSSPMFNLLQLQLINGSYEFAVSAYSTTEESVLSNIVSFVCSYPFFPSKSGESTTEKLQRYQSWLIALTPYDCTYL